MVAVNRLLTAGLVYAIALLFFNTAWVRPEGAGLAMGLGAVGAIAILVGLRNNFPASAWSLAYPAAVFAAVLLSVGQIGAAIVLLALALGGAGVVLWSVRQDPSDDGRAARAMGLAVVLGCLVAFYSSPQGAPGDLALRIASFLHVAPATGEAILIGARKTVHFLFYGLMGLAAWRAALLALAGRQGAWEFGLFFVFLHATFDESRQSLYASRTGSGWDVLLDLAGAITAIWLLGVRRQASGSKP